MVQCCRLTGEQGFPWVPVLALHISDYGALDTRCDLHYIYIEQLKPAATFFYQVSSLMEMFNGCCFFCRMRS